MPSVTRVCLIGPIPSEEGGVAKSTLYLMYVYRALGYNTTWLTRRNGKLIRLRECDVVCAQGPFSSILLKSLLLRKRIILTLRGWVLDEVKASIFASYTLRDKLKKFLAYVIITINWLLHKLIFIPLVYDYVTAVSHITAKKNGVKALIVPNPTICKSVNLYRDPSNSTRNNDEVVFITYVSIGGGKIFSVPRLVKILYLLNEKLRSLGFEKHVILYIYGKDVPRNMITSLSRIPYVRFMGYVKDYLDRLKQADLFLAGYTFPELGHAVLEAICAGVPVAKFTEDSELEEVINGYNGILALSDEEMVEKLVEYVLNMDKIKQRLAINAKNTIVKRRDFKRIAAIWKIILKYTLAHSKGKVPLDERL
jgi:glycosyltransferase involved in cell wall biosynthesis